ncbi:MAG: hypothetical protein AAFP69_23850, partial [Planctomycetota bacterium]
MDAADFDPVANKETDLGGFSDKSLRLTGQAQLTFQQNQIQRFDLQRSATVSITPIVLTSQIAINIPGSASWDIAEGDRVTISGTGLIDGTHKILDRLGDQILISHPNANAIPAQSRSGNFVFQSRSWTDNGFAVGQQIEITGGANAGRYTISSVSPTTLTVLQTFATTETIVGQRDVDVTVVN